MPFVTSEGIRVDRGRQETSSSSAVITCFRFFLDPRFPLRFFFLTRRPAWHRWATSGVGGTGSDRKRSETERCQGRGREDGDDKRIASGHGAATSPMLFVTNHCPRPSPVPIPGPFPPPDLHRTRDALPCGLAAGELGCRPARTASGNAPGQATAFSGYISSGLPRTTTSDALSFPRALAGHRDFRFLVPARSMTETNHGQSP